MERYLIALLALLLARSIGAFFLFVAILPIIAIGAVIAGLIAMFGLGYRFGHPQDDVLPDEDLSIREREVSEEPVSFTHEFALHK